LVRALPLPSGYFSIEVPLVLLILSTLVFRVRDAEALAQNPLDSAAIFRLLCVGAAALLAWLTLLRAPIATERIGAPAGALVFGGYTAVVFLGAPLSLNLPLTAYRGVELAVGLLVVVAAVRFGGIEAIRRLERVVLVSLIVLLASVWVGVLLRPSEAVATDVEPFPYQIQGLLPAIASNGVGELGALVFLWALGMRVSGRSTTRWHVALMALGLVSLLAAQYRTGYLGTAVALVLLLVTRRRRVLAAAAVVVALSAAIWSWSSIVNAAEPYVLRGQTREQAAQLSGRVSFWTHALGVWEESPLLGKGLLTATRFEVLARLGYGQTSTIHGTWVEALVGTGVVGVALLLAFLVLLWRAALRDLVAPDGLVYPGLLVAFVTVRSLTGPTFEVFGLTTVIMLVLSYVLAAESWRARGSRPV
ncbi:MAG: O-antigen ligase family protein, partial [Thermoleophilia bacterium]|nr:O-antigen ligase family protein [Gaiellaceae bacterium]MDW8338563.1 O-antigen ligase family protein [Thermoleophilia bacterium]